MTELNRKTILLDDFEFFGIDECQLKLSGLLSNGGEVTELGHEFLVSLSEPWFYRANENTSITPIKGYHHRPLVYLQNSLRIKERAYHQKMIIREMMTWLLLTHPRWSGLGGYAIVVRWSEPTVSWNYSVEILLRRDTLRWLLSEAPRTHLCKAFQLLEFLRFAKIDEFWRHAGIQYYQDGEQFTLICPDP